MINHTDRRQTDRRTEDAVPRAAIWCCCWSVQFSQLVFIFSCIFRMTKALLSNWGECSFGKKAILLTAVRLARESVYVSPGCTNFSSRTTLWPTAVNALYLVDAYQLLVRNRERRCRAQSIIKKEEKWLNHLTTISPPKWMPWGAITVMSGASWAPYQCPTATIVCLSPFASN